MPSELAIRKILALRRRQLNQRHIESATLINTQRTIRRNVHVAMRRAELAHVAGQMSGLGRGNPEMAKLRHELLLLGLNQ